MSTSKSRILFIALIAAASLPLFAQADTPAAPEMTPAEAPNEALPPMMMQGMMGMRHGLGSKADGQGAACQTRHPQMGPMDIMGQEKKCHHKCDMNRGGASEARINELEKRLDLLQSMVQLMASEQDEE